MGETFDVEQFIAEWRDTGGSGLANMQSFINGLCRLIGVEPPRGSRTDDAQKDYAFKRPVFQDNGDGTSALGGSIATSGAPSSSKRSKEARPIAPLQSTISIRSFPAPASLQMARSRCQTQFR